MSSYLILFVYFGQMLMQFGLFDMFCSFLKISYCFIWFYHHQFKLLLVSIPHVSPFWTSTEGVPCVVHATKYIVTLSTEAGASRCNTGSISHGMTELELYPYLYNKIMTLCSTISLHLTFLLTNYIMYICTAYFLQPRLKQCLVNFWNWMRKHISISLLASLGRLYL